MKKQKTKVFIGGLVIGFLTGLLSGGLVVAFIMSAAFINYVNSNTNQSIITQTK